MRVAIVGGKLQGIEAVYLAKKAGWETLLIDKGRELPAAGIADQYLQVDVTEVDNWDDLLQEIDLVIPALENQEALDILDKVCGFRQIPFLYDREAYQISCSKLISNRIFAALDIPAPLPWPKCGLPIIAKPSGLSGSTGVKLISTMDELKAINVLGNIEDGWVLESYLQGPSFSIEVIGFNNRYYPIQITELEMDKSYDCKRVTAPSGLESELKDSFYKIAKTLASSLNLRGIMDIEVILNDGKLKVLEIDARLPSQTPITVYHSSGVNMLQILGEAYTRGTCPQELLIDERRGVIFEHIKVSPESVEVLGEHVVALAGPLRHQVNFFGADEALTNYEYGKKNWVATLIVTGVNRQTAWNKRCRVIEKIMEKFNISQYKDFTPEISTKFSIGVGF